MGEAPAELLPRGGRQRLARGGKRRRRRRTSSPAIADANGADGCSGGSAGLRSARSAAASAEGPGPPRQAEHGAGRAPLRPRQDGARRCSAFLPSGPGCRGGPRGGGAAAGTREPGRAMRWAPGPSTRRDGARLGSPGRGGLAGGGSLLSAKENGARVVSVRAPVSPGLWGEGRD